MKEPNFQNKGVIILNFGLKESDFCFYCKCCGSIPGIVKEGNGVKVRCSNSECDNQTLTYDTLAEAAKEWTELNKDE